jgi:hypothetical protein
VREHVCPRSLELFRQRRRCDGDTDKLLCAIESWQQSCAADSLTTYARYIKQKPDLFPSSRPVSAVGVLAKCLVLLLARAARQAGELFRNVLNFFNALGRPIPPAVDQATKIEFENGSRIIALPGKESTIRSYNGVKLLIIDEAARVPEDLYRSVRPMLAVSNGRLILLSTPWGRRGFFFREWHNKETNWLRFEDRRSQVPAHQAGVPGRGAADLRPELV